MTAARIAAAVLGDLVTQVAREAVAMALPKQVQEQPVVVAASRAGV